MRSLRYWAGALAVGVGAAAAAGGAGAGLTALLRAVQHLAFGYSETSFLAGVERAPGWRRVAAMAAGGLLVGLGWTVLHARAGRLRTVPGALTRRESTLPVVPTSADAVLQIVAVGVGAPLGREGAPRQVGAAVAGWLGARLRLAEEHRRVLFACGAGAGLAAVYGVPVAGTLFTLEALLVKVVSRRVLLACAPAAALTALAATLIARPVVGGHPLYAVQPAHLTATITVWAVLAGPVVGAAALGFDRLTTWAGAHAPHGRPVAVLVPVVFTAVGALSVAYPQVLGNGRGPAQLAFAGTLTLPAVAALTVLRPLATAASLRSGATGGRLTPGLATGALVGALLGRLWSLAWPGSPVGAFAVVAAAAFLAVSLQAPLTAIALVLEFTANGLPLAIPILLAAVGAVALQTVAKRVHVRIQR